MIKNLVDEAKYKQSSGSYNSDFQLEISTLVTKLEVESIFKFIDSHFITFNDSVKPNPVDYNQWLDRFIFQGCSRKIDNKLFVTAIG